MNQGRHPIDHSGEIHGNLVITRISGHRGRSGNVMWEAVCSKCGKRHIISSYALSHGKPKCSDCTRMLQDKKRKTYSNLRSLWGRLVDKCTNKTSTLYGDYGGRGIGMCAEWMTFHTFRKWANESGYESGKCLALINPNGNYSPNNCKWVEAKSKFRMHRGKTLSKFCRDNNLNYGTVMGRIKRGISQDDAVSGKWEGKHEENLGKPVAKVNQDGSEERFASINEAMRGKGMDECIIIRMCLHGKIGNVDGVTWKFISND